MVGLSESVKKEKFVMKIFFSDNVEWSSKNLEKMVSADVIKGYLCYKMITSQDVLSEVHVKKFLFLRKVLFSSQDI